MKDYVGQWFEIYRRHAEPSDIGFELTANGKTEKILFPHEKADGAGALFAIAAERNWQIQSKDSSQKSLGISFWTYFKNILLFLIWTKPQRKNIWPFEFAKTNLKSLQQASVHFSKVETEKLKKAAASQKVSWNSLLFYSLHQSVAETFRLDVEPKSWWIPVNMRAELGFDANDPALKKNYVSNFTARVSSLMSLHDFHQLISKSLKQKRHWGTWWWQHIGKALPETIVEKIALNSLNANYCVGAFTNLGEWTCSEQVRLTVYANALKSHPIGASAIVWNEELNLGISLYPTFQGDALKLVQLWEKKIRSYLDL